MLDQANSLVERLGEQYYSPLSNKSHAYNNSHGGKQGQIIIVVMVVIIVMVDLRVRHLIGNMEGITVMVPPNLENHNCR